MRALAAVVALMGLLAGIPWALAAGVGWPLPTEVPSVAEVGRALNQPIDAVPDEFILKALALVVWVAWGQLVVSVVVELVAAVHARRAARVPLAGPVQALAARLVAPLVVVLSLSGARPAMAAAPWPPVMAHATAAAPAPDAQVEATASPSPTTPEASTAEPAPKRYVVRRGDNLWDIAEAHLRDELGQPAPDRYMEIFEANKGIKQPDGRWLRRPGLIRPGWALQLPADAVGLEDASPAPPPSGPEPAPTVAPAPTTPTTAAPTRQVPPATAPAPPAPSTPSSTEATERQRGPGAGVDRTSRHGLAVAALGVPLMAAGGVVLALARLRRVQMARRRPGRDIARPGPELEPSERRLRAVGAEEVADWLDAALRYLVASVGPAGPQPDVVCVRVGDFGVEFLLQEALGDASPGFEVADGGQVWRLQEPTELSELHRLGAEHAPATPALVSLGSSPEGPVMVNLEHLGVTSVEGPAERVEAYLAGLALELAVAPWARGVELLLLGDALPALSGLEDVRRVEDLDALGLELAQARSLAQQALGPGSSPLAARTNGSGEDVLPVVVIAGAGRSGEEIEALTAQAGPGVIVVTAGPVACARWRVMIAPDGAAVLEPFGLRVQASGVDEPSLAFPPDAFAVADQSALKADDVHDAARLVAVAAEENDVAPVVDLEPHASAGPPKLGRNYDVMVRVLGPPEVDQWALPLGRHRHLAELVAYLAVHDQPVSGEALRCSCWIGEISYDTFKQTMSRARKHLGTDAEGRPHLLHAEAGKYGLGPGVGCDWVIFQELARAAQRAGPSEAMDLYRQALELVRGEPFAGVAPQTYLWAWTGNMLAYEMSRVIGDAATQLAELALASGDADTASWATRQGLLATPAQLSLFEMEMRAAATRRDVDGLTRSFKALHKAHTSIDPLGEVPAATVARYRELLAEAEDARSKA